MQQFIKEGKTKDLNLNLRNYLNKKRIKRFWQLFN